MNTDRDSGANDVAIDRATSSMIDLSNIFRETFGAGEFDSFEKFAQALNNFEKRTHSVYRVHKSVSVAAENHRRKDKIDEKFKYAHATFTCVHYGQIVSKAEGKRQKQR